MNYQNSEIVIQGFSTDKKGNYLCLFCRQSFLKGDIYSIDGRLVDAEKAMRLHIEEKHGSVFDALIEQGKKFTGLTDTQAELMSFFYAGLSDKEIAAKTELSDATVRYQRFHLREKAKQANVYLALFKLMEERSTGTKIPEIHDGATMIDERYMVTEKEEEKILNNAFLSMNPLLLRNFPPKEKKKLVILRRIVKEFSADIKYSEPKVNEILKKIYKDYVTLRRYLIEYGFLDRTRNGKEYWLK